MIVYSTLIQNDVAGDSCIYIHITHTLQVYAYSTQHTLWLILRDIYAISYYGKKNIFGDGLKRSPTHK